MKAVAFGRQPRGPWAEPPDLLIIGNARSYHAVDWYRTVRKLHPSSRIVFVTDLIHSEGHTKIVDKTDDIVDLLNIDRLLLRRQGRAANLWRNFIKFLLTPVQALRLRAVHRQWPSTPVHAHSMYYMFLCYLCRIDFIATPVGSEILVRPDRSVFYRWFARRSVRAARVVLVDSVSMQDKARELFGVESVLMQYGVPVSAIRSAAAAGAQRKGVLSLRGVTPLYRIDEILRARENSSRRPCVTFTYPFWDTDYREMIRSRMQPGDQDLGRVPMEELYRIYSKALLAISIPRSDSSPRSVYSAIFAGCCVAVTPSSWIESLPSCMRERLVLVDLENRQWLDAALAAAERLAQQPYIPSQEALATYDQDASLRRVAQEFYTLDNDPVSAASRT